MQPISNADPLGPEVLDRARRMAWLMHRKGRGSVPLTHLGSGCFSQVFDLGDGLVLKVGGPGGYGFKSERRHGVESVCFRDEYDASPRADVWPEYVKWIAGMKRRPKWAPRVYHMEALSGRVYFAVCEKLEENYGTTFTLEDPKRAVSAAARHRNFRADLHDYNFMRRPGTDEIVINDPWCPHSNCSYEVDTSYRRTQPTASIRGLDSHSVRSSWSLYAD